MNSRRTWLILTTKDYIQCQEILEVLEMENEEWSERLNEVEKDAKKYGNKKAADDLFRPGSDGKPLTQKERDILQHQWDEIRKDGEARRQPI
ncbi:hypothetical protein [Burkholderia gladioli]|uniref:hypothetical protein n=2 Tax=Burkholderia gladioli TaxID=28095 RepID=UPI001640922E|nr:hypothetical protein [Burkholderia gladioli]